MSRFFRWLFRGGGNEPNVGAARDIAAFPPGAPPDVVVSYSRLDRAIAEQLILHLRAQGINVWWDKELFAGEDLHDAIVAALDAARAVIVIWSDAAAASLWVRDEARRAVRKNKLITAHVPGFDLEKIPLGFGERQCDSVEDPAKLVRALGRFSVVPKEDGALPKDPPPAATGRSDATSSETQRSGQAESAPRPRLSPSRTSLPARRYRLM
jgi:TIR domain-containing protein